MQKAINRFWDWLFHPSIRWYKYPKGKASWFRYPSPGNYTKQDAVFDFKKPFQHSQYNVRFRHPVQSLIDKTPNATIYDSPLFKVVDKLKAVGLLSQKDHTQQQIEQAKKKYLSLYGIPVQQRVYRNQLNIPIPEGTNRQSYRQIVQHQFKSAVQYRSQYGNVCSDRRFIQSPEKIQLESLDLFSAPHFQQTRLQVNYKLDNYANQNAKRGYIQILKGQKTFWKALDNSNDSKNIENVQKSVGDSQPNNFKLQNTKIYLQKDSNGNVIDVHPKTTSI